MRRRVRFSAKTSRDLGAMVCLLANKREFATLLWRSQCGAAGLPARAWSMRAGRTEGSTANLLTLKAACHGATRTLRAPDCPDPPMDGP